MIESCLFFLTVLCLSAVEGDGTILKGLGLPFVSLL